jgi:phosphomannomutase
MTYKIKFGTDGWRAIIAKEYTVDNVMRVAAATGLWCRQLDPNPSIVIGFDCRFGGQMFMQSTARVLASHGIKVFVSPEYVSTPMVSLATKKLKANAGIVITASHNPASYNGFKIKAYYGGPASPLEIDKIEKLIPDSVPMGLVEYNDYKSRGLIEEIDMEEMYFTQVIQSFDMASITGSGLNFGYDAMYGAGQQVMRRLIPEATFLHCEYNPGFDGQAPEPIHKNLLEFSEVIKMSGNIASGLATDGDADRIGLYNSSGDFIDSHHLILILINYLHKFKGLTGKVVTSFSCTSRIKKMCETFSLEHETSKIGFKYICDIMVSEDVLLGGEESGGIAIKGHIPERDGIWNGMVIWEYMAKTGKSLDDLIKDVYAIVGSFSVDRDDLAIEEEQKRRIIADCLAGTYNCFGDYEVESTDHLDGFKFHLGNERWVMIRPSGTEPVLRIYAESENKTTTRLILDATRRQILG